LGDFWGQVCPFGHENKIVAADPHQRYLRRNAGEPSNSYLLIRLVILKCAEN